MVDMAVSTYGKLDCAFNNAGVGIKKHGLLHELDIEKIDLVLDVNLHGAMYSLKYELEQLVKQGSGGSIVNNNSVMGLTASDFVTSPYTASKHGLRGITKTLALEYGRYNIRVNDVNPGFVGEVGLAATDDPVEREFMKSIHPNEKAVDIT
eukprot:UN02299